MTQQIAVVIPCYMVRDQILSVIETIGPEVNWIIAVDDACPQGSGKYLKMACSDPRLSVVFHEQNQGVGGAVMTGYQQAANLGAAVLVKLDGDGQHDARQIERMVRPILDGLADYTKGNRFYNLEDLREMPKIRLIGNAGLSFFTKLSSGYWTLFDPTNGFTALHSKVFELLALHRVSRRFFFESDMLFHLSILRARVVDIPMVATYGAAKSNLSVTRSLFEFFSGNLRNLVKRIFYSYFLRDFSLATLELIFGTGFIFWGSVFGLSHWIYNNIHGISTPVGTVMLAVLPIILGIQFLLAFISYDMSSQPTQAIHPRL